MKSRYGHAIRHCAARRPSRNKEKGWRSKFPGVGWMEVFQKGSPAASICGAGTQPTALRFRSCGRAPSIHRTTARAPSYHHDAIRHRTAPAFRPLSPGQDDDGLLASRASRNTTTPPYILPPAKTDVVADMSGHGDRVPSQLPVDGTSPSPSWAAFGTERLQTPFQRLPGGGCRARRVRPCWKPGVIRRSKQPTSLVGCNRPRQSPAMRVPLSGIPHVGTRGSCFLRRVSLDMCWTQHVCVGAGAAVGSRLIDGVEVPGLG